MRPLLQAAFAIMALGGTAALAVPADQLVLDLDAAAGVEVNDAGRVVSWTNQVADSPAKSFLPNDVGRKVPGSGMPIYQKTVGGRRFPAIRFQSQELINDQEAHDAAEVTLVFNELLAAYAIGRMSQPEPADPKSTPAAPYFPF